MRTITIEEHFLSSGFREVIERRVAQRGGNMPFAGELLTKLSDLGEVRLKDMDAGGIDLQVISHTTSGLRFVDDEESERLIPEANDQLAGAIEKHPTRFAGFAILPLTNPQAALAEMERAMRLPGIKGVMVNGTTKGRFLDDPAFLPILEWAVELDVPIYIHPAEPPDAVREAYYGGLDSAVGFGLATSAWGWHSEVAIHSLRLILAGVFDRLPGLRIIIGHMGEMIPFMLARIDSVLSPQATYLRQRVPDYFLQNFVITTSGFFTEPPLRVLLETMGIERVIYSVDYPYSSNELGRAFLERVVLTEEERERMCYRNVERVLKIKKG